MPRAVSTLDQGTCPPIKGMSFSINGIKQDKKQQKKRKDRPIVFPPYWCVVGTPLLAHGDTGVAGNDLTDLDGKKDTGRLQVGQEGSGLLFR